MRALLLLSILASGACLQAADNAIEWLGSYREARQRSRETGKPILVEFRCEA